MSHFEASPGEECTLSMPVKNSGTAPVTIAVTLSGSKKAVECFRCNLTSLDIEVGGIGHVAVTFAPPFATEQPALQAQLNLVAGPAAATSAAEAPVDTSHLFEYAYQIPLTARTPLPARPPVEQAAAVAESTVPTPASAALASAATAAAVEPAHARARAKVNTGKGAKRNKARLLQQCQDEYGEDDGDDGECDDDGGNLLKVSNSVGVNAASRTTTSKQGCLVGGCSNIVDGRGLCVVHCKRICRRGSNCKKHSKISTGNVDASYERESNTLVPEKVHGARGRSIRPKDKSTLVAEARSAGTVLEYGLGAEDGGDGKKEKRGSYEEDEGVKEGNAAAVANAAAQFAVRAASTTNDASSGPVSTTERGMIFHHDSFGEVIFLCTSFITIVIGLGWGGVGFNCVNSRGH